MSRARTPIAWLTIPPGSAMVVDRPAEATPDTVGTCYFETWTPP